MSRDARQEAEPLPVVPKGDCVASRSGVEQAHEGLEPLQLPFVPKQQGHFLVDIALHVLADESKQGHST